MDFPTVIIVPGWRNSGPGHWQTLWSDSLPSVLRVEQDDWVAPVKRAWGSKQAPTAVRTVGPA